jgi:transposase
MSDFEWIRYLHSVGLLKASFRPPEDIGAVRTLWRRRGSLLQMAAQHTQHMQKSLTLMNPRIDHMLSDITGVSGLAILDEILAGNRDPLRVAHLCDIRVRSPRANLLQALMGDYRPEHLFPLTQSLDGYRYDQKRIAELDDEIARHMHTLNATGHPSIPNAGLGTLSLW